MILELSSVAPVCERARGSRVRSPVTFFRFEGVLSSRSYLEAPAYFAANGPTLLGRLPRLATVASALPLSILRRSRDRDQEALDALDRRAAWLCVRHVSEDRLIELGEEYASRVLAPRLDPLGLELLAAAREARQNTVLLSDGVDVVLRPIARMLEVSHLVCNTLETRSGRATGRLAGTVVGEHVGPALLTELRERHGFDLASSRAYAGSGDRALLDAVGSPAVVAPPDALRQRARDLGWTIVR